MALSQEQALETCRESVGRPIVQACMQSMRGGGGDRESALAKCRGAATTEGESLHHGGAQQGQWPRQRRHRNRQGKGRGDRSWKFAAGRLRGAAAHHRRHHRDPRQREAGSGDAGEAARKTPTTNRTPRYRRPIWRNFTTIAPLRAPCWAAARRPWPMPKRRCPIARSAGIRCLPYRIRQFIGFQKQVTGDLKSALKIFQDISSETNNVPGLRGWVAQRQQGHDLRFCWRWATSLRPRDTCAAPRRSLPKRGPADIPRCGRPTSRGESCGRRTSKRAAPPCLKRAASIARRKRPTSARATTSGQAFRI